MSKSLLFSLSVPVLLAISCLTTLSQGQNPPSTYYEVRVYHPMPSKYDAIVDRFRQYTTKLFEKHGMKNIGYWTPTDTSRKELIYILSYPGKAARDTAWKHFGSDPDWRAVVAKTEANGKLVEKVDSYFMTESDLSPVIKLKKESPMRTFELRTYTAQPDKLPNLLTRFRDHTKKLFTKHGMENIAYWTTVEKEGTQPKLVYILAHPSEAEGKANFDLFRKDPVWEKVKAESEKDGPLTVKVESVYMRPTDYSPLQ